ncbi:MAG: hypothetical protein HFI64_09190, partial [Lachnospiraceae bacterium]|nr:hypothetical protein [Lachnospiraceae bacterium]
ETLYQIGDKVVHPMHGAGVIDSIVQRKVSGRPDVQMAEDGDGRALLIFSVILTLVMGNAAPRIPVNRVMGIRLPWTLKDPDTWRAAHRMMGYCAFPTAVFMLAGGLMVHPVIFSVGGLLMVAVIPSVYSYIYDRRKRRF